MKAALLETKDKVETTHGLLCTKSRISCTENTNSSFHNFASALSRLTYKNPNAL